MTNLESINFPFKCISYYVSSKSAIDKKDSYSYWFRGKMIRIIADKPFARGDVLIVNSIKDSGNDSVIINVTVDSGEYEQCPVLSFVSTRLVYNRYSDFTFTTTQNIKIVKVIEQVIDDNYSACFIVLAEKSGTIKAVDKSMNNYFDINIILDWCE
jgi:hypothetical protein